MTYSGHCACRAVSVAIHGAPVQVRQCWCFQCQQIAAGGPTNNAIFRSEYVALSGVLASHAYSAASGNTLTQWFCPNCGTPAYAQSSARPQFRTVRLGLLDPGHDLRPQMAIWTDDAPDWAVIDSSLEKWAGQPPSPLSSSS